MKKLLLALLCATPALSMAQATDTLYYDSEWKGTDMPMFASYYRVVPKDRDNEYAKPFRDYYITGELQCKGKFISIDRYDDSNSKMDGEVISYYENGVVASKAHWNRGVFDGECISYNEAGYVKECYNYKEGKLDGMQTIFNEDGTLCKQIVFNNGEPASTYTLSTANGYITTYSTANDKPVYVAPEASEVVVEYAHGKTWQYYNKNGVFISLNLEDYDARSMPIKAYRLNVIVQNNSLETFDFNPDEIASCITDAKGKRYYQKMYSAEEVQKKVQRKANVAAFMRGLANVGTVNRAATTTTRTSNGRSVSTYDGLAAYQVSMMQANQESQIRQATMQEIDNISDSYIKLNTIKPGQTVSGCIYVEVSKKSPTIEFNVPLLGQSYVFQLEDPKIAAKNKKKK